MAAPAKKQATLNKDPECPKCGSKEISHSYSVVDKTVQYSKVVTCSNCNSNRGR